MADESLGNDLVNAVVLALKADASYWSPPVDMDGASPTPALRAENSREGAELNTRGQQGVASVSLIGFEIEESFEESALTRFDIEVNVDVLETRAGVHSSALLARAITRTFGDGGARVMAHLAETTTAQLGKTGDIRLGNADFMEPQPGRVVFRQRLEIRVWVALAQPVPTP